MRVVARREGGFGRADLSIDPAHNTIRLHALEGNARHARIDLPLAGLSTDKDVALDVQGVMLSPLQLGGLAGWSKARLSGTGQPRVIDVEHNAAVVPPLGAGAWAVAREP